MVIRRFATVLALSTMLGGADCFGAGNDDDPRFSLCVLASGTAFTPGQTSCPMNFSVKAGQPLSLVVWADNHSGVARTAPLSIKSGTPAGWSATFGSATIPVPGSQTLTITTTVGTPTGGYPITIQAKIDEDQDPEAQIMVNITN